MQTHYKLRNGKICSSQPDKPPCFLKDLATGQQWVLTDDWRGGVLGDGFDVMEVREPGQPLYSEYTPGKIEATRPEPDFPDSDAADAFRYALLQQGETLMGSETTAPTNSMDGFKTVDYYNGSAVSTLSDRDIFFIIQELQDEQKALRKLKKDKSKAVKAHQKRIQRNINKLMAVIDARH
jgi:hypothetical protein